MRVACRLGACALPRLVRQWHEVALSSEWRGGALGRAGGLVTGSTGMNNPQFRLTVARHTSVFVALSQTSVRWLVHSAPSTRLTRRARLWRRMPALVCGCRSLAQVPSWRGVGGHHGSHGS